MSFKPWSYHACHTPLSPLGRSTCTTCPLRSFPSKPFISYLLVLEGEDECARHYPFRENQLVPWRACQALDSFRESQQVGGSVARLSSCGGRLLVGPSIARRSPFREVWLVGVAAVPDAAVE